jgi:hypothetical protein
LRIEQGAHIVRAVEPQFAFAHRFSRAGQVRRDLSRERFLP